jgi:hypothetical protein
MMRGINPRKVVVSKTPMLDANAIHANKLRPTMITTKNMPALFKACPDLGRL